jgi:hypothetical protein
VTFVPRTPVEFKRRIISLVDFKVDGIHTQLARFILQELNRLEAKPTPAVRRVDVQFIDECIVAVKFEAKADGKHDVANDRVPLAEKPNAPERAQRQKLPKGGTGRGLVKLDFTRFLFGQLAHHAKKLRFILKSGFPDHQLRHVTPRFVR